MLKPMSAAKVLEREFLEIRANILVLAAAFDRLDRGPGSVQADPRMKLIDEGLAILRSPDPDRAERVQLLFSRQYDQNWRQNLGVE